MISKGLKIIGKFILALIASVIFPELKICFSQVFIFVAIIFRGIFVFSIKFSQNISCKILYTLLHEIKDSLRLKSINFKNFMFFIISNISICVFHIAKHAQITAHILVQEISFIEILFSCIYFITQI